jgi:hypothetical protein
MSFCTCNVWSLYRAGSLTAAARELARYKLDLVGVQVRWDTDETLRAGDYNFLSGRGKKNHQLGTAFFVNCSTKGKHPEISYVLLPKCRAVQLPS